MYLNLYIFGLQPGRQKIYSSLFSIMLFSQKTACLLFLSYVCHCSLLDLIQQLFSQDAFQSFRYICCSQERSSTRRTSSAIAPSILIKICVAQFYWKLYSDFNLPLDVTVWTINDVGVPIMPDRNTLGSPCCPPAVSITFCTHIKMRQTKLKSCAL